MKYKLSEQFNFSKKSALKAGLGKTVGKFPFFTSSNIKRLFLDEYIYDGENVIIGTGGFPSCNYYYGKCSTSTDNFVLSPRGCINAKYLYYFLRNKDLNILNKGFRGVGIKHISKDYVSDIEIFISDKYDQGTIVENLDEISESLKVNNVILNKIDELVKSRFVSEVA